MQAKFRKLLAAAIALAGCAVIHPAQALTADGLTHTVAAFATPNPTVADLTPAISGIDGSADTEGGRY